MSVFLIVYHYNDGIPREIEARAVTYGPYGHEDMIAFTTPSGAKGYLQKSQILMVSEKLSKKELMK